VRTRLQGQRYRVAVTVQVCQLSLDYGLSKILFFINWKPFKLQFHHSEWFFLNLVLVQASCHPSSFPLLLLFLIFIPNPFPLYHLQLASPPLLAARLAYWRAFLPFPTPFCSSSRLNSKSLHIPFAQHFPILALKCHHCHPLHPYIFPTVICSHEMQLNLPLFKAIHLFFGFPVCHSFQVFSIVGTGCT